MKRCTAWKSVAGVISVLAGCVLLGAACGGGRGEPLVVLIGLDGLSPGLVDDLRAEGRLPVLDRLMRSGTWGLLQSVQSLQVAEAHPQKGYFSPVVWTSIATGKVPEKHGVLDFALPRPGTSFVWAGGSGDPPHSVLSLPEVSGAGPFELRLRLRSYERNGAQSVQVSWNGRPLGAVQADVAWKEFRLAVPPEALRPVRNRLELVFARQSRPADLAGSTDQRALAGAVGPLEVLDRSGAGLVRFDPIVDRFALGEGFYVPEAQFVDAQSAHWRARPLWSLLGEQGHRVGVLGWWATWPAQEVNGWLVSSHMGLRGRKRSTRLPQLTWPPELADELMPLAPSDAEIDAMLGQLYPPGCVPARPDKLDTFRDVMWQDEFFSRIARKLVPGQRRGLLTVYFESTDVGGHHFLPLRDGLPLPEGCPESVRTIIEKVYEQADRRVGEILGLLPEDATVLLMSDHGMVTLAGKGEHYPYGLFVAAGPEVRRGALLSGASALDVAPTVLHLFGQPIPLDMDGKLLVQIFDPGWLAAHPARYGTASSAVSEQPTPLGDATQEVLEKLKGIGYIE
jgi:predicted AlkP superfamily phosphohydrolase/phosphomutase